MKSSKTSTSQLHNCHPRPEVKSTTKLSQTYILPGILFPLGPICQMLITTTTLLQAIHNKHQIFRAFETRAAPSTGFLDILLRTVVSVCHPDHLQGQGNIELLKLAASFSL